MSRQQAVGALVFHEGKLLLVQRSSNDTYLPNAWELPGGKVERGEDPHTAVSRETLEETGLQCDFGQMSVFKHPSEQTDYHAYLGSSDSIEVTLSDEHQAWDWVTVEEALELLTEEVVSFTPHTAATLVYLTSSLFSLPTFSAEKISKQEFTGYLDWLESGGHYVDLAQEAPRYYELLKGDLTVNEVDADFTHEDEFILLGAEDVPRQGVFVKSFTTTSTIYLHGRPVKRVSGVNHEGKARAYANWMEDKLHHNPNYFRRYRSEEFNYGEDSYDMDLAVAQFLFALIEIRNLLQQGRTEEALSWINDEYLADAVDEIEDDDLRQQVVNLMNQKSGETFESDQIRSLNHPNRPTNLPLKVKGYQPKRVEIYLDGVLFYVGDFADRHYSRQSYQLLGGSESSGIMSIINPSGITLDDVNKIRKSHELPSWTGKYWLYTENYGGQMLDNGFPSFLAESFEAPGLPINFPQGVFSNDMSREGMPQLSRQAFRKMQAQGHQLEDIKRVYDRLMCQHSKTGPDDVYDFDEYEDGSTFTVDISWRCPDCGAFGDCEDFEFDSYSDFWGTDPDLYPVTWYARYRRYPQWSDQDTEIVELMPLPEYTDSDSAFIMKRNAESLTGKDMSYCRCGTEDEVGGFTCGQHCKRIEKNGEYTPSQTLGDYDARELALSSVATGDFNTDSLKFSSTRMASEEYNEDNQKMQEAAEKIIDILGEPDSRISKPSSFYASLGEPYTSDMVYVLEYELLTDEGSNSVWNFGLQMARKLRQQGIEPWRDDRWTGDPNWPTYVVGPFHLERETFTVTVLEANPAVESVVRDLHRYFAKKYGVIGQDWEESIEAFEPAFTVALDDEGNVVTADNIEINTTWSDSMRGFEAEETKAKPSKVEIKKSTSKQHKLMAIFYDKDGDKIKTTHFGWRGMSDYTRHKDKERMKRYDKRHGAKKSGENWKKPMTAGALSKWILWNKPSLKDSFEDYKRRFNLTGDLKVTKSSEEV